jgi:magnesium-transporting ATPase (P-type)
MGKEADTLSTKTGEKMLPFLASAKVSSMSIDDVERDFQSQMSSGLVSSEAERRKRIYGLNEFDVGPDTPLWRKYVDQV